MKKQMLKLILVMALLVGLGCASSGGKALLPIHKRPTLPKAILEPQKVFLKCGDDYFCIAPEHLEQLRVYTIEMDALVKKYENATEVFNE